MKKTSIFISGVTGQDGSLLASKLIESGFKVIGGFRRGGNNKFWRTDYLNITDKIDFVDFHLEDPSQIQSIFNQYRPSFFFNMAGESFVADSFRYPSLTFNSNTVSIIHIIESINNFCPDCKCFFASSSEIYGPRVDNQIVSELSSKSPDNPYGAAKLAAYNLVNIYKNYYDLKLLNGIFFNHESILRSTNFVSRKITMNLARLKKNQIGFFELGNINTHRDWGSAGDYVEAIQELLLNFDVIDNFNISTGNLHTVKDVILIAAKAIDLNLIYTENNGNTLFVDSTNNKPVIVYNPKYSRKYEREGYAGDNSKIFKVTGWKPKTLFSDLISEMAINDYALIKN